MINVMVIWLPVFKIQILSNLGDSFEQIRPCSDVSVALFLFEEPGEHFRIFCNYLCGGFLCFAELKNMLNRSKRKRTFTRLLFDYKEHNVTFSQDLGNNARKKMRILLKIGIS